MILAMNGAMHVSEASIAKSFEHVHHSGKEGYIF
jgi:hypothetical protein